MLTDDQARTLMHEAAATIDVPPAAPLGPGPRRPAWVVAAVGAAAAVALVAVTLSVVTHDDSSKRRVVHPSVGRVVTVPSVLGLTESNARRALESAGAHVVVSQESECAPPGRALRTEPAAGSRVETGWNVTLWVSDGDAAHYCDVGPNDLAVAWSFLDFATGQGAAPAMASQVVVRGLNGPVRLDRRLASAAANWGPDLSWLADKVRTTIPHGGEVLRLDVLADPDGQEGCGAGAAGPSPLRPAVDISVILEAGRTVLGPPLGCLIVHVYAGAQGITQVTFDSAGRFALPCDCVILIPHPQHVPEDLKRVAQTFLAFARGEQPSGPPVDTPVGLYLGGELVGAMPSTDSRKTSAWEGLCLGIATTYAGRDCPFSMLEPFADPTVHVHLARRAPDDACSDPRPLTPRNVGASTWVTLVPATAKDCTTDVALQLFVNDVGQIVAANLVWGEP